MLAWANLGWQDAINHRAEAFLWVIIDTIPILTVIFVWRAIFQQSSLVGGVGLSQIITYYFFMIFTDSATSANFDGWLIDLIRDGEMVNYLTKPMDIFARFSFGELAYKLLRNSLALLVSLLALFFVSDHLSLTGITPGHLFLFILFIFLGFWISVMMSFIVSAFAFWFKEANSLIHLRWWLGAFFSGQMFPLFLLPRRLEVIAQFLPFKFLIYIPIQVITGQLTNWVQEFFIGLAWFLALYVLARLFWRQGIKRFSGVGI